MTHFNAQNDARDRSVANQLPSQAQTGQPWKRKWNWLLDKPDRASVLFRSFVAAALLFNGIVVGVLQLTPVWGPPTSVMGLIFSVLGVLLLPVGLSWAWSAVRLWQTKRNVATPEP